MEWLIVYKFYLKIGSWFKYIFNIIDILGFCDIREKDCDDVLVD